MVWPYRSRADFVVAGSGVTPRWLATNNGQKSGAAGVNRSFAGLPASFIISLWVPTMASSDVIATDNPPRIDLASAIGVFAGPGCILLGQWLEGGTVSALLQRSAALIVIGATIGACMVSFSLRNLSAALRDLRKVISEDAPNPFDLIDRIVTYATILRREGPVRLQRSA